MSKRLKNMHPWLSALVHFNVLNTPGLEGYKFKFAKTQFFYTQRKILHQSDQIPEHIGKSYKGKVGATIRCQMNFSPC